MRSGYSQPDLYARRAKQAGLAARSVYKLEEMDQKWRLLRPGMQVLELGAAPGSWLQYAAKRVGPTGHVFAIDLKPIEISLPAHTTVATGDAFALDVSGWPPMDVVLSDMAPATMGHHQTDALRSAALAEHALALALRVGKAGSALVVKVLEGGEVPALGRAIQAAYQKVVRVRPKATRKQSTELFLLGLGKRTAGPEPAVGGAP